MIEGDRAGLDGVCASGQAQRAQNQPQPHTLTRLLQQMKDLPAVYYEPSPFHIYFDITPPRSNS